MKNGVEGKHLRKQTKTLKKQFGIPAKVKAKRVTNKGPTSIFGARKEGRFSTRRPKKKGNIQQKSVYQNRMRHRHFYFTLPNLISNQSYRNERNHTNGEGEKAPQLQRRRDRSSTTQQERGRGRGKLVPNQRTFFWMVVRSLPGCDLLLLLVVEPSFTSFGWCRFLLSFFEMELLSSW